MKVSTLITDLDNTLWDWVGMWHSTFSAMFEKIVEISGLDPELLKKEIREVHQRRGTSEYAFLIQEIPSLQALHPQEDLTEVYEPAIRAFVEARRRVLALYPEVSSALMRLNDIGCLVVGYTESMAYYTGYRVRKLGLDGLLDYLYSPPDHDFPRGISREELRRYSADEYRMKSTIHRHTPPGELKPNPGVLESILEEVGARADGTIYLGDSLMKDVSMAQAVGVADVLARYGDERAGSEYALLKDVTHWTEEDVKREARIRQQGEVVPTHTLENSIAELFDIFEFTAFERLEQAENSE